MAKITLNFKLVLFYQYVYKKLVICLKSVHFIYSILATHLSILREASSNTVIFNYTSVRGNLTEEPLIDGNVSWCPDDNELKFNPALKVDLGQSIY